jgi:hypothetical protein
VRDRSLYHLEIVKEILVMTHRFRETLDSIVDHVARAWNRDTVPHKRVALALEEGVMIARLGRSCL